MKGNVTPQSLLEGDNKSLKRISTSSKLTSNNLNKQINLKLKSRISNVSSYKKSDKKVNFE